MYADAVWIPQGWKKSSKVTHLVVAFNGHFVLRIRHLHEETTNPIESQPNRRADTATSEETRLSPRSREPTTAERFRQLEGILDDQVTGINRLCGRFAEQERVMSGRFQKLEAMGGDGRS